MQAAAFIRAGFAGPVNACSIPLLRAPGRLKTEKTRAQAKYRQPRKPRYHTANSSGQNTATNEFPYTAPQKRLYADPCSCHKNSAPPTAAPTKGRKQRESPLSFSFHAICGRGIAVYRELQRKRVPFITGILHENDVDYQVAGDLAVGVIFEKSFEKIAEGTCQKALEYMSGCHTVINCIYEYGEMNAKNRELYEAAKRLGIKAVNQMNN